MTTAKHEWRRRARQVRRALVVDGDGHRDALARFLAGRAGGGWVVGYDAMADEVDLAPLLERPELGPFALTRTPDVGRDLTVHPTGRGREWHRYGFHQPVATSPLVADDDIAVVLVPGLLFGPDGTRLGRGAGYYDRFLGRLEGGRTLVGITAGLVVDGLPFESHDVAMTHLATAAGVHPVPVDADLITGLPPSTP
ncbi:MAG: 5-formyltetrahydrofolate cyclo-ligase [Acidimicrobiales bacterium]